MSKTNKFNVTKEEFESVKSMSSSQSKVPKNHPKRNENESFWDFIERGHELLVKENPEIISQLKSI